MKYEGSRTKIITAHQSDNMSLCDVVLFLSVVLCVVVRIDSISCLTCQNIDDPLRCNTTTICSSAQVCFLDMKNGLYNMGCISNQQCGSATGAGIGIVGRGLLERQVSNCHECCSTDGCNSDLCKHQKPITCIDDETVDCAKMSSFFHICNDIHQASLVCPKFCNLCNVVDGNWAEWSSWSNCDVTCGNGSQTLSRTCTNPAPAYGGIDCVGSSSKTKVCQKDACPVNGGWSQWTTWGACSVTCGVGMQTRDRSCSNPYPKLYGDHCYGESRDDRICMSRACVDGGWTSWESWDACSVSCGGGIRSRSRTCTNPKPSLLGHACDGNPLQVVSCNKNTCPLGVWSDWQTWTNCSVECGGGVRTRSRLCSAQLGSYCPGNSIDIGFCKKYSCDSDCYDIHKHQPWYGSGVYSVLLWKSKERIEVYCDMETDGGGWTVFQYRFNGHVDFYRRFSEYDRGFGNLKTEFWLGLKFIQEMSSLRKTELRLDLTAADKTSAYEVFQNFYLGSSPYYTLHVDKGTGTAGDSTGLSYSNGKHFSTYDADRDDNSGQNCAVDDHGGWWYSICAYANLNGEYVTPGTHRSGHGEGGMIYNSFKGEESLRTSKMMFRRV